MMPAPNPTPILRLTHVDNLEIYLARGGLHAPNFTPADGLKYRTIHDVEIQTKRRRRCIPCGPRGVVHDYLPFYFGTLTPMLLQLKTGQVAGYNEGQEPLIYLVTTAQEIASSGAKFVFSDGHGLAAFTRWYDDLRDLDQVDWGIVNDRYWADTPEDNDRKRRKQAEFLIREGCPWARIQKIVVLSSGMRQRVESILQKAGGAHQPVVDVRQAWYY
jgi:hypothetical protein